jgi:hypothetical protein
MLSIGRFTKKEGLGVGEVGEVGGGGVGRKRERVK